MKRHIQHFNTSVVVAAALLSAVGCTVKPPQITPTATPTEYIFAQSGDTLLVEAFGWWEFFGDTTLNRLVERAVENNPDIVVAASKVVQARSELTSIKSSLLPSLGLGVGAQATYSEGAGGKKSISQQYSLLPQVSWEVDLFGGISGATDAARASLLATEWGYRGAILALEAQVAETYFQWLQYARSLQISERSYELRLQAQQRTDSLFYYGFASGADLQQAHSLTATAAADIPSYRRAMIQTNMVLATLIGEEPHLLAPPTHTQECEHSQDAGLDGLYCGHLTATPLPLYVASGLPSSMLERRPDVMEAFYRAEAAAAQTRVAHAKRLPSFSLTGEGGVLAYSLKGLTAHNPFYWQAVVGLTQPILNFGGLKAGEEIAVEQWRQAMENYRGTMLQALADVESALVAIETYNTQAARYLDLLEANRKLQQITSALYADGLVSYLNVIDAERNLYSSQLDYIALLTEQLTAFVTLYKALGG